MPRREAQIRQPLRGVERLPLALAAVGRPDELEQVGFDATVGVVAESRAAFIRDACKQRLKSLRVRELDRSYVAGYRRRPEDVDWAESSTKLLSKRLPKEKW